MINQTEPNLDFPPSQLVKRFAESLEYGPLYVLDAGCCTGRNSRYLASLGHSVIGLSLDMDELKTARDNAPETARFIAADVRCMPLHSSFDVILMNEVMHQLPKSEEKFVINSLKKITKPNGFHVISDYIGDKPNALNPGELYGLYAEPGWKILDYYEDLPAPTPWGELNSIASIIAFRK